eukprot:scaffold1406_cov115-Isochrysis_galbana.AAC.2
MASRRMWSTASAAASRTRGPRAKNKSHVRNVVSVGSDETKPSISHWVETSDRSRPSDWSAGRSAQRSGWEPTSSSSTRLVGEVAGQQPLRDGLKEPEGRLLTGGAPFDDVGHLQHEECGEEVERLRVACGGIAHAVRAQHAPQPSAPAGRFELGVLREGRPAACAGKRGAAAPHRRTPDPPAHPVRQPAAPAVRRGTGRSGLCGGELLVRAVEPSAPAHCGRPGEGQPEGGAERGRDAEGDGIREACLADAQIMHPRVGHSGAHRARAAHLLRPCLELRLAPEPIILSELIKLAHGDAQLEALRIAQGGGPWPLEKEAARAVAT